MDYGLEGLLVAVGSLEPVIKDDWGLGMLDAQELGNGGQPIGVEP